MLQCLTGVYGAFDRRHHRCASGTRSFSRCCSRAVAVISLQIQEQIVDVPVPQIKEEIVEIVAGEVVCNARTGVRRKHGWTCPQSPEQNVEVIQVILQEQCWRMRFSFDSVWEGSCGRHVPHVLHHSPLPHARVDS